MIKTPQGHSLQKNNLPEWLMEVVHQVELLLGIMDRKGRGSLFSNFYPPRELLFYFMESKK
jgi:hypothetical protein